MAQRTEVVADNENNVPSAPAVTAVGTALGDELLPAEGNASVSSIAGSNINVSLVGKSEHPYSAFASVSTIEQYLRFFLSWNFTVPATRAKRV